MVFNTVVNLTLNARFVLSVNVYILHKWTTILWVQAVVCTIAFLGLYFCWETLTNMCPETQRSSTAFKSVNKFSDILADVLVVCGSTVVVCARVLLFSL